MPFWGYRRLCAHVTYIDGLSVSKNKVHRLMKAHNLLVAKNIEDQGISPRKHTQTKP